MKKQFNLSAILPKIGFKITHKDMTFPAISTTLKYGYEYDFDVFLETKGYNLQRPFVWTLEQKREFILSILKDINIPPVSIIQYTDENKKVVFKVIDGKQRIGTALQFFNDEFTIVVDGEEYLCSEIPFEVSRKLLFWTPRGQLAYSYYDEKISDDDLINWFNMLNFAGTEQDIKHKELLSSLLLK